jgi:hypothetical protein
VSTALTVIDMLNPYEHEDAEPLMASVREAVRRSITAIVLAAALLLAAATPAGASGRAPLLLRFDDTSHFAVRPATLSFGADGGQLVLGPGVTQSQVHAGQDGHIRWTKWSATGAHGVGTVWINRCRPDCAAGHYLSYPVRVQASQVLSGRYTRLTLFYRRSGQPKDVHYHLKRFAPFYGWQ